MPAEQNSSSNGRPVKIVSHTDLFYKWPVWVVWFVMAILTKWEGHVMAIVPAGTSAEQACFVDSVEGPRDVLVVTPSGSCTPLY